MALGQSITIQSSQINQFPIFKETRKLWVLLYSIAISLIYNIIVLRLENKGFYQNKFQNVPCSFLDSHQSNINAGKSMLIFDQARTQLTLFQICETISFIQFLSESQQVLFYWFSNVAMALYWPIEKYIKQGKCSLNTQIWKELWSLCQFK